MTDANKRFYDEDAQGYDSRWELPGGESTAASQGRIVEELTADWAHKKVLEVGSGTGRFSQVLAGVTGELTCLDIARSMLLETRARLGNVASDNRWLVEGSVLRLPFQASSFDAVFSVNVFNHLREVDSALAEVSRVLRPGGSFLLSFANLTSYYFPFACLVNSMGHALGKRVYSHWWPAFQFDRKLKNAGLEAIEIRGNVHVPKWLDFPVVRAIPVGLDSISRRGALARLAPTVFASGRKRIGSLM